MEQLEQKLSRLDAPSLLRDRSQLKPLQLLSEGGVEIAASGVTLVSLVSPHLDYFRKLIGAGTTVRLLLLDPSTTSWKAWHESQRVSTPEDTNIVLRTIEPLVREGKGIEVRLSPWNLPVSLVVVDASRDSGRMNVEFAFTSLSLPARPHMYLTKRSEPEWFEFFVGRFEYLWSISKPWTPASTNSAEPSHATDRDARGR